MRKALFQGLLLALLVVNVAAGKSKETVYVDYDRSVDFSSYKTFQWVQPTEASMEDESEYIDRIIKVAIFDQLRGYGMKSVQEDPDVYVTYHASSTAQVSFNIATLGYGYGAGWYWNPFWGGYGGLGIGARTPTSHIYERGTLIMDIWDAKLKLAIFRGTVEAVPKDNPEKAAKQIEHAVAKIAKEFDSMYSKGE